MAETESGSKANIGIRATGDSVVIVINDITPLVVTPAEARKFADGLMVAAALVERRVRPPEVGGLCAVCAKPTPERVCDECRGLFTDTRALIALEPKKGRRKK
jgi:hypothetical protein